VIESKKVKHLLQSDQFNSKRIVDLLCFLLDGVILSSNLLIVLLAIDDREVYALHNDSKLGLTSSEVLVSQLTILDSLGTVLGFPLLFGFFGRFDLSVDELIRPIVPLNQVGDEFESLLKILVECFVHLDLQLVVRVKGHLQVLLGNLTLAWCWISFLTRALG